MTLVGARWSAACRCARWGAYTALEVEGAEPSEQTRRYFQRGRMFEEYVARQFEAKYGRIERQREIPWPHGTAHADIYVHPEKLIVEVFSTVAPRGLGVEDKLRQVKGYLYFDEDATRAALYIVDPSALTREDLWPVTVSDEDEVWIRETVLAIRRAVETNGAEMPACSSETPDACRYRGCPFTDQAWAGWEEPAPTQIEASPELAQLLVELQEVKSRMNAARSLSNSEHMRCQELQNELANLGIPAGKSAVGPFEIRRTPVKGRESFSVAMARKAGAWTASHDEQLGPFMKVSDGHERWELKRVSDEALVSVDAFGEEVPF